MRNRIWVCVVLLLAWSGLVSAQESGSDRRVALEEQSTAVDRQGTIALAGRLLTRALSGTPDAPVKNARFIIENRSAYFYTYVSGSATFYNDAGVRCGEGQFTINALASGEQVETDAPGLRLTCDPRTWRIVANNLLTPAREPAMAVETAPAVTPVAPTPVSPPSNLSLEIVLNGKTYYAPLGSTLEIPVRARRITLTVRAAQ